MNSKDPHLQNNNFHTLRINRAMPNETDFMPTMKIRDLIEHVDSIPKSKFFCDGVCLIGLRIRLLHNIYPWMMMSLIDFRVSKSSITPI